MNATALRVTVRRMRFDDVEQVHAIDQRSFPTPWTLNSFRFELSENRSSHSWVAEVEMGGEKLVVGAIVVWLLVDDAHIGTIAVDAPYRRQGIGRRMLCIALAELARAGAVSSTLEVRESNLAAQEMYRQFGYETVGRRRGYYPDNGEDALVMALEKLDTEGLERAGCGGE